MLLILCVVPEDIQLVDTSQLPRTKGGAELDTVDRTRVTLVLQRLLRRSLLRSYRQNSRA
jgi:hypothetical protein